MAFADTLTLFGSCKIQPFINRIPPATTLRCYCASSSSSSSRFIVTKKPKRYETIKFLTVVKNFSIGAHIMYSEVAQQLLSFTVLMLDEDGQLRRKFDELVDKETFELDVVKKTNIVLDEIVPLLLKNADRWMSTRFIVSSDLEDSLDKLLQTEEMLTEYSDPNGVNNFSCTKVFVDVSIMGRIDEKFKYTRTQGESKALLHHLMSMKCVKNASSLCTHVLMSKETSSKSSKASEDHLKVSRLGLKEGSGR